MKVIDAIYIRDYLIAFQFQDGTRKVIDFKNELWGAVFEPLRDINVFKKFKLNYYTIEWENGADFAPEFLYNYTESK
jgi:hypothetical protein